MRERYILMHRNDEILSFFVSFDDGLRCEIIEKRSGFDKSTFCVDKEISMEKLNSLLSSFLTSRAIPMTRWDYEEILKNTGAKNVYELSFKGHGLSLSNHYWYQKEGESLKYEDINFFTNKWDDSFARCVLKGDYESLKNVSLNVPDLVTPGWGVKGWLCKEDGPHLYKIGIAKDHYEEPVAEVLASRFAKRLFNKNEVVDYQLKEIYGKYASASKVIIGIDEELVPLSDILSWRTHELYRARNNDHDVTKAFFRELDQCDVPGLKEFFVKISCFRSLCFVNDLHFDNLSVIRNINTGEMRLAPLLDLGSSFGSSERARNMLSKANKATYMIVYFIYSDLDPDWDYSWYKPELLDGFENEIKEYLSKSDFYTDELIDNIIDVYHHQKDALNTIAGK